MHVLKDSSDCDYDDNGNAFAPCFFCAEQCNGRGHSNRFNALQGFVGDDVCQQCKPSIGLPMDEAPEYEEEPTVVYACDDCFESLCRSHNLDAGGVNIHFDCGCIMFVGSHFRMND